MELVKKSVSGAVSEGDVPAGRLDFIPEVIGQGRQLHPMFYAGNEQVQLPAYLGLPDQGLGK